MCKMTQEELADIIGMSLTSYRDLEKGPTAIINANIPKIADATGSTVEEILLGFRPMPSLTWKDLYVLLKTQSPARTK